jgi:RNA polymerase sigma-70 factor (ECF subfamily)
MDALNPVETQGTDGGSSAWAAMRQSLRAFVGKRVHPSDVDDVVQEILIAIAAPGGAPRTGPYVHGVARRVVVEHYRKKAREQRRLARLAAEPDDPGGEPTTDAERNLAMALALFLPQVTPRYRDALRAVDLEGESQADVARRLGVPLSTLRTWVQRGRAELRALLRACCQIDLDARGRVVACEPHPAGDCACE